jgi:uncharacterized protein
MFYTLIVITHGTSLKLTDPDDNKFVDCAIAANAKYIVTGDRHFNIMKSIDFLKLSIITAYDFQKILKNQD